MVILEEEHCDQAHGRAHDTADADRDCIDDELRSVGGTHHLEGKHSGNLTYDEKLQDKCDGDHDGKFPQSNEEGLVRNSSHIQCNIVNYHAIYHNSCHDNGEDDFFKLILGHKKLLW